MSQSPRFPARLYIPDLFPSLPHCLRLGFGVFVSSEPPRVFLSMIHDRAPPAVFLWLFLLCLASSRAHAENPTNPPVGGGGTCTQTTASGGYQGIQWAFNNGLYGCSSGSVWVPEAFLVGSSMGDGTSASCSSSTAGLLEWTGSALQYCNGSAFVGLGGGTVNTGTQYQIAYYATTGTQLSGDTHITTDSGNDLNLTAGAYELQGVAVLAFPYSNTDTTSIAVGNTALASQSANTLNNTAVGYLAGEYISSGASNTAIGESAMEGISGTQLTGSNNTAVGAAALLKARGAGAANTAVGEASLTADTTGADNTALGYQTGKKVTTGTNNTILGYSVASTTLTTGGSNILIGTSSAVDTPLSGTNNLLNIGNLLQGDMTSSSATYNTTLYLQSAASAVNFLEATSAATTVAPALSSAGTDTNIGLAINTKGTSSVTMTAGGAVNAAFDLSGNTNAMVLPSGTTGQRPSSLVNGMIRYNSSSTGSIEAYYNSQWNALGGGGAPSRYALTDGPTIAVNWTNGNMQSVTLGGNRTFTFTGGQDGGSYVLILKQDGTGSRTVTWPGSVRWSGGTAPTLTTTASKTDYIGFIYNGLSSTYDGVAMSQNF
jgi:hypothetical protein